jgi:hypothetical protein
LILEDFAYTTGIHGILSLTGFKTRLAWGCPPTIWNEGSAHMVVALYYAGRAPEATAILTSLVASEDELPEPEGSLLRGWPHSLECVHDGIHHTDIHCGDGHYYGPEYGIHVGASAWLYFAVKSHQGDLLPYREFVQVPGLSGWTALTLTLVLAIVGGSLAHEWRLRASNGQR